MIWSIESLSSMRYIESMIAARLAQPDASGRLKAFEAFGNLWRFTGTLSVVAVSIKLT